MGDIGLEEKVVCITHGVITGNKLWKSAKLFDNI